MKFFISAVLGIVLFFSFSARAQVYRLQEMVNFTDFGKNIFLEAKPVIIPNPAFSESCNRHDGVSSLGCYDGSTIRIFQVKEARLEGLMASTAAHEMLHAAYKKLSRDEKENIDKLLLRVVSEITDKEILNRFQEYRKQDPQVLPSEYHSIVGTEILSLPLELENHYRQYFKNRKALVALSQSFYDELNHRKKSIAATDSELEKMREGIESQMKALKARQGQLDAIKRGFEKKNSTHSREDVEDYNRRVEKFNKELQELRRQTTTFNQMAKERNLKAIESRKIYDSLDSKI